MGPFFSNLGTSIFEVPNATAPPILGELGQIFKNELIMMAKSRCEHMSIERKSKSFILKVRN